MWLFFYETASCPGMNWFPFCHLQTHLFFISRIRDLKLSKDLFNIQLEKTRDLYFIKQNDFIFALCVNSKKFCLLKGFFLPISILKKNSQPLMSAVLKEKKRQIGIKYSLNSNYTLWLKLIPVNTYVGCLKVQLIDPKNRYM